MKYGCNYSKELMELLREDSLFCDYIKIGSFGKTKACLADAFQHKPLLIHGFGWHERGGMVDISLMDFDLVNKELEQYKSPFLGMHTLAFASDIEALLPDETMEDHMVGIFSEIKNKLLIPLLVENLDYFPFGEVETTLIETVEPEYLTRVMNKADLMFLFDLSHAKVSAYQMKIDIFEYIERLPLERIKEIHFSGSVFVKNEGFKDIHGIMDEDDYRIGAFLANHPRIRQARQLEVVTLEYGTIDVADKQAIVSQMKSLREIFG